MVCKLAAHIITSDSLLTHLKLVNCPYFVPRSHFEVSSFSCIVMDIRILV